MTAHPDENWTKFLFRLKAILNNMVNIFTGKCPNEVIHGYKLRNTLFLLTHDPAVNDDAADFLTRKTNITKKAKESIAWANLKTIFLYDSHRKPIQFERKKRNFHHLAHKV